MELIFEVQEEISFKTFTFSKASLISLNNSAFNGCEKSSPSTHLGNFILIWSAGNSYNIFEKILFISFYIVILQGNQ